jgi:uncharacterized membrane protein
MSTRRVGVIAFWGLLGLQFAWHGLLAPPAAVPMALPLLLLAVPLLPPALGLLLRWPNALFWAAVVSLLHFSVGVMELWTTPGVRMLAGVQVVLALLLIGAVASDGLERRRAARAAVPPEG